jgi:hypothetical protein
MQPLTAFPGQSDISDRRAWLNGLGSVETGNGLAIPLLLQDWTYAPRYGFHLVSESIMTARRPSRRVAPVGDPPTGQQVPPTADTTSSRPAGARPKLWLIAVGAAAVPGVLAAVLTMTSRTAAQPILITVSTSWSPCSLDPVITASRDDALILLHGGKNGVTTSGATQIEPVGDTGEYHLPH